jgi:hypothetical protein
MKPQKLMETIHVVEDYGNRNEFVNSLRKGFANLVRLGFRKFFHRNHLRFSKKFAKSFPMDVKALRNQLEMVAASLAAIAKSLDDGDHTVSEETQKTLDRRICLVCGESLGDGKSIRGNHPKCYHRIMRRIALGEITDAIAVASGLLGPHGSSGRPRNDDIESRIAAAAAIVEKSRAEFRSKNVAGQDTPSTEGRAAKAPKKKTD